MSVPAGKTHAGRLRSFLVRGWRRRHAAALTRGGAHRRQHPQVKVINQGDRLLKGQSLDVAKMVLTDAAPCLAST